MEKWIPKDVTVSILQRLSFISNLRFRCVCKSWHSLLCVPNVMYRSLTDCMDRDDGQQVLIMNHCWRNTFCHISLDGRRTPLSIPNIDKYRCSHLRIVGSCNGLCLTNQMDLILVWNPLTRETKVLPRSPPCSEYEGTFEYKTFEVGFWFDAASNDHKVVKIFNVEWFYSWKPHFAFLYSFSIGRWRRLFVPMWILTVDSGDQMISAPINSAEKFCHWVGEPYIDSLDQDFSYVLVSFDTVLEVFKTTQIIPYTVNHYNRELDIGLFMLKGCVAISASRVVGAPMFEISVLGKVGVKESWIKLIKVVPIVDGLRVLNPWRKGKLFVATSEAK